MPKGCSRSSELKLSEGGVFPYKKGSLLKAADTSTVTLFCRAMTHQSGIKISPFPAKRKGLMVFRERPSVTVIFRA